MQNLAETGTGRDTAKSGLRRLQEIELDILKRFLSICEQYSLTYYMLGGTLLGAVRHQGFIPWDDDIDIGMPRPDYERFLTIAERELSFPYRLHTLNTPGCAYSYYYARMENETVKLERNVSFRPVVICAWIDIFPLDGVPDDIKTRNRWLKKCTFYHNAFIASQYSYLAVPEKKKRSFWKRSVRWAIEHTHAEKIISTRLIWKQFDRALRQNDFDKCHSIINFCGYWKLKEMFPKTIYGKGKLYPFEDLLLNGPEDADFVLRQMYGDYMTPPEDAQRDHHYISFITDGDTTDIRKEDSKQ